MLRRNMIIGLLLAVVLPLASFAAGSAEKASTTVTTLKLFLSTSPNFSVDNNPVLKALADQANVKLSFELPPSNNYAERLQILFAGGDLPDIIHILNNQMDIHRNAAEQGMIVAVDQYLAKAPNIMAAVDPNSWASMKLLTDGKIYGVPKATLNRQDGFLLRKDWLDKFGITVPDSAVVSMDTFVDIMKKFTRNDPDGNGKNDTYGLGISSTPIGGLKTIDQLNGTFGLLGWQKAKSGSYEYMNAQWDKTAGNYKDALAFPAMLWKEGLVDPNWPNNKEDVNIDRFMQGMSGMTTGTAGNTPPREKTMKQNNPKVELTYIARVALKQGDDPVGVGFGNGAWGTIALTSAALKGGRMEAAFRFLETLVSDKGWDVITNGVEGVHYGVQGGKKVFMPDYDKYVGVRGDHAVLRRYNDVRFSLGPANMDDALAARMLRWVSACTKNLVISMDMGYTAQAAKSQKYIDYMKVIAESISKIIIGDQPVGAWDGILDGWYKNGGEEVVKEVNAYLKNKTK